MYHTECSQEVLSLVILCQAGKSYILAPNCGHLGGHLELFYLQLQQITYKWIAENTIQFKKWCNFLFCIKPLTSYDIRIKGASWISRLAQGYTLVIRLICIIYVAGTGRESSYRETQEFICNIFLYSPFIMVKFAGTSKRSLHSSLTAHYISTH